MNIPVAMIMFTVGKIIFHQNTYNAADRKEGCTNRFAHTLPPLYHDYVIEGNIK